MNVTELARKLKLSVKITRHVIPRVGFDIGMKAIKVDDAIAHQIIERVQKSPHVIREVEADLKKTSEPLKTASTEQERPEHILRIPNRIAVRELAQLFQRPVTEVVSELMKNGIFANLNEEIDFETATIIAEDMGYKAERLEKENRAQDNDSSSENLKELLLADTKKEARPPVVVIMGHVDHGKTMLLDTIRKTHVVDEEAGGITQHIGAYQIDHKEKRITFIDTPGHEAFTAMRSRGANVADIAILVIAWDEGLKPQTTEAIKIIEKIKLPFIVAITKMDKPESKPDKVLQQLAEINYVPEEWGGQTITVSVSAKSGAGIEDLLNMVLLRLETETPIVADSSRPAVGTVIESHIDKGEGPVATVVIQTGTLNRGDLITAGEVAGKVKSLKDDLNKELPFAGPGMPVRILGLKELPQVGDILQVTKDKKILKKALKQQKMISIKRQERRSKIVQQVGEEDNNKDRIFTALLKTDKAGTREAVLESIEKLPQDEVRVQFIKKGIGNVNESDISDAASAGSVIYAFHVAVPPTTRSLIQKEGVEVREFDIIYKLIEDVAHELELRLPPEIKREQRAKLSVTNLFRGTENKQIVGGTVQEGTVAADLKVEIRRGKIKIGSGKCNEVRIGPKKVPSVGSGTACGVKIEHAPHIQEGDLLLFFVETKTPRKLSSQ